MYSLKELCLAFVALSWCGFGKAYACSEPELDDILYCMAESPFYECLDATSCSDTDVYSYLGAQATISEVVYDCCEKPDKKRRSKCLKDLRSAFKVQDRAAMSLVLKKEVARNREISPPSPPPHSSSRLSPSSQSQDSLRPLVSGRDRNFRGKSVRIVPKSIIPYVTGAINDLIEKVSSLGSCESTEEEVPDDEFLDDEYSEAN